MIFWAAETVSNYYSTEDVFATFSNDLVSFGIRYSFDSDQVLLGCIRNSFNGM